MTKEPELITKYPERISTNSPWAYDVQMNNKLKIFKSNVGNI
jgi:hypothetical protein